MTILYLVRGLPGSGKSTYCKGLHCFHVEADMYFMQENQYKFNPTELKDAHSFCFNITEQAMLLNNKIDIAVSNTFTQLWELQPYIDLGKKHNRYIEIITIKSNFSSTHNVPEESIKKMSNRWELMTEEKIIVLGNSFKR